MEHLFDVVAEDHEFLVINKPAGLVCHPTKGDIYSSLVSRIRVYLGGGDAHLVNRLDRETSGIVIAAKISEAGARLRKLWETGAVHKEYLAIVHGHLQRGTIIDASLGPDPDSQVAIKDKVRADGARAITRVFPLDTFLHDGEPFSQLRVVLLTGRKHQIRIHLSHIGHPIVGDKLYGGDERLYLDFVLGNLTAGQKAELITDFHCLHAGHLSFELFGVARHFYCPPEAWFQSLLQQRGPLFAGPDS